VPLSSQQRPRAHLGKLAREHLDGAPCRGHRRKRQQHATQDGSNDRHATVIVRAAYRKLSSNVDIRTGRVGSATYAEREKILNGIGNRDCASGPKASNSDNRPTANRTGVGSDPDNPNGVAQ
jgi:hypothetical protein